MNNSPISNAWFISPYITGKWDPSLVLSNPYLTVLDRLIFNFSRHPHKQLNSVNKLCCDVFIIGDKDTGGWVFFLEIFVDVDRCTSTYILLSISELVQKLTREVNLILYFRSGIWYREINNMLKMDFQNQKCSYSSVFMKVCPCGRYRQLNSVLYPNNDILKSSTTKNFKTQHRLFY